MRSTCCRRFRSGCRPEPLCDPPLKRVRDRHEPRSGDLRGGRYRRRPAPADLRPGDGRGVRRDGNGLRLARLRTRRPRPGKQPAGRGVHPGRRRRGERNRRPDPVPGATSRADGPRRRGGNRTNPEVENADEVREAVAVSRFIYDDGPGARGADVGRATRYGAAMDGYSSGPTRRRWSAPRSRPRRRSRTLRKSSRCPISASCLSVPATSRPRRRGLGCPAGAGTQTRRDPRTRLTRGRTVRTRHVTPRRSGWSPAGGNAGCGLGRRPSGPWRCR